MLYTTSGLWPYLPPVVCHGTGCNASLSSLISTLRPSSTPLSFFSRLLTLTLAFNSYRDAEDLEKLSELGHFLKGSSATLGLVKVRDGCEKIQRYGKQENLDGSPENDVKVCLEQIKKALTAVKSDYEEVETGLRNFYKDDDEEEGA